MKKIEVTLEFARSTKGTHLYVNETGAGAIQSLYIKKHGLPDNPPSDIKVTVTEVK